MNYIIGEDTMEKEKLDKLFELARELYKEEQEERRLVAPIQFCRKQNRGQLIIFSMYARHSKTTLERLTNVPF